MGTKKRRNRKEEKVKRKKWTDMIWWIAIVIVGLVISWFLSRWMQSISQGHYAKPGEITFSNGLWEVILYMSFLVGLTIVGYFMAKKLEG
jgi:uncharacterized membrane protein SpoIIM required for sporulation